MRIPTIIRRVLTGGLVCVPTVPLAAQPAAQPAARVAPRRGEIPAAYAAVREADLRRDVGELASPAMRGREGGTRDELRAAMWIAERYRRIGLQPAHAAHPVVPLAQVVAVLNGDMIGRTHPDSASLLGTHPPHRNSGRPRGHGVARRRADRALRARHPVGPADAPGGVVLPERPRVPYVRRGVPALMDTTDLHDDYHTPRDRPDRIDDPKLTRMAQWMYRTGWFAATAPERPTADLR